MVNLSNDSDLIRNSVFFFQNLVLYSVATKKKTGFWVGFMDPNLNIQSDVTQKLQK